MWRGNLILAHTQASRENVPFLCLPWKSSSIPCLHPSLQDKRWAANGQRTKRNRHNTYFIVQWISHVHRGLFSLRLISEFTGDSCPQHPQLRWGLPSPLTNALKNLWCTIPSWAIKKWLKMLISLYKAKVFRQLSDKRRLGFNRHLGQMSLNLLCRVQSLLLVNSPLQSGINRRWSIPGLAWRCMDKTSPT